MKKRLLLLGFFLSFISCKKESQDPAPAPAPARFSISYDGNGSTSGTAPSDNTSYAEGAQATVLENSGNLARSNFSFVGWNTAADGTGSDFAPGSPLTIGKSNVKLFAKWVVGTVYKLVYNGNGNTSGSVPVDNNNYQPNAAVSVMSGANLNKNGAAFLRWNTSPAGSGQNFSPGSTFNITGNTTLYAMYSTGSGGSGSKYYGFNASGQLKSKSSTTSDWSSEDLNNTFGSSNLVTVVWNGSRFVGFNASGQTKSKSSNTSSWSSEDLSNTFGSSNVVAVAWNGSKYIGFNASGQAKSKSSLTSSWNSEDLNNTFGSSNIVCVVWNGSKYIGFNASGQTKSKSSLTSSWVFEDTGTFGTSNLVAVVYTGSRYIGFNASGQTKSKTSASDSWSTEDLNNTFGPSVLVCAAYH